MGRRAKAAPSPILRNAAIRYVSARNFVFWRGQRLNLDASLCDLRGRVSFGAPDDISGSNNRADRGRGGSIEAAIRVYISIGILDV